MKTSPQLIHKVKLQLIHLIFHSQPKKHQNLYHLDPILHFATSDVKQNSLRANPWRPENLLSKYRGLLGTSSSNRVQFQGTVIPVPCLPRSQQRSFPDLPPKKAITIQKLNTPSARLLPRLSPAHASTVATISHQLASSIPHEIN
jgi:hypothetical protein